MNSSYAGKRVMIVAPHPDDETLGCGGTLLKYQEQESEIYWLIITNATLENGFDKSFVNKRKQEIEKVSALYSFKKTISLDFPPTGLDSISKKEIINKISQRRYIKN